MRLGEKNAVQAREILRRPGLQPMEGSNDPRGEFWISEAGYPYFFPYSNRSPDVFVEQAFDEIVDKLT